MAHLLSKHIPGATAVAEPATGSAHSLEMIHRGEATIGLVGLASAYSGVRGQREFDKKYDNVGFVMAAMDSGQSIVTLADSGIKTFADVKGLHVGVNAPASKTQLLAALKLYGLNYFLVGQTARYVRLYRCLKCEGLLARVVVGSHEIDPKRLMVPEDLVM